MSKIALLGPDGKPTPKCYEIVEITQQVARVKDVKTGQIIRIHKSRIIEEPKMPSLQCTCGKEFKSQSGLTLHMKKCSPLIGGGQIARKKKTKSQPSEDGFNVLSFVKESGGELWTKGVKFDHTTIRVIGHQVLDERSGYYFSFNTYNGSLGKNGKGITKYPLRGKSIAYTVSDNSSKRESRGEKRARKGKKTAEQIRKLWSKNGYKKAK